MKAISVRRPWPWAILYLDKTIENRSWPTSYRGPILLHAAKGCTPEEYDEAEEWMYRHDLVGDVRKNAAGFPLPELWLPELDEMPAGGIVGRAELVACLRPRIYADFKWAKERGHDMQLGHDVRWWHHEEQYGFVLEHIEPLPFTPWRGERGLFDVDVTKLRAA